MRATQAGPTLFELLDKMDHPLVAPGHEVVHALMPWMGLACGAPVLGLRERHERSTCGPYDEFVTCPECLAIGDLHQMAQDAQRPERMAKVAR
jgi:hypothetical protein